MIVINGKQLEPFQEVCFLQMCKRELERQNELPEVFRDKEYREIYEMAVGE